MQVMMLIQETPEDFAARFGDRFAPPEQALARLAETDALAA